MLLIKKRYPKRTLFAYGGVAFVSSFVLATSVLASNNVKLEDFIAASPAQESSIGKDASEDTASEPAGAPLNDSQEATQAVPQTTSPANDTAWTTSAYRQQPSEQQPAEPAASEQQQPTQPQPSAPSEPADETEPSEPTSPTEPAEEPVDDDPGLIEEIVDVLDPTNP